MAIGVTGNLKSLGINFPLSRADNAGNMIHGIVPFRMFDDCHLPIEKSWRSRWGSDNFRQFVNEHCSHLVVTVANLFKSGVDDGRYEQFIKSLSGYDKPIVIFGLGVQASTRDISKLDFSEAAVRAMRFLGERCSLIGVRGEFTAEVFDKMAQVKNTFVTGCPSFFSNPEVFKKLYQRYLELVRNVPLRNISFNSTHLTNDLEARLMADVIRRDGFYVEVQNRANYEFLFELSGGNYLFPMPKGLENVVERSNGTVSERDIRRFFRERVRLFRDVDPWLEFHAEHTSFTTGTRFHGNMASLLGGVPALWLTHDIRTQELSDYLRLPAIDLQRTHSMTVQDLIEQTDYAEMFDGLHSRFERFNEYLDHWGLPRQILDF